MNKLQNVIEKICFSSKEAQQVMLANGFPYFSIGLIILMMVIAVFATYYGDMVWTPRMVDNAFYLPLILIGVNLLCHISWMFASSEARQKEIKSWKEC